MPKTGSNERRSCGNLPVKTNALKKKRKKSYGIIGTAISIDSRPTTFQREQTDSSHFLLLATHWCVSCLSR